MATGLAISQVAHEGNLVFLAEIRHGFQEVGRGFWKAGWAEAGKHTKARGLEVDWEPTSPGEFGGWVSWTGLG